LRSGGEIRLTRAMRDITGICCRFLGSPDGVRELDMAQWG
jgi:hypothetical protein